MQNVAGVELQARIGVLAARIHAAHLCKVDLGHCRVVGTAGNEHHMVDRFRQIVPNSSGWRLVSTILHLLVLEADESVWLTAGFRAVVSGA
jgi:hypothetical protein